MVEGIEDPRFRRLLGLCASAAKSYTASQRSLTQAARAEIVFGEGAGLRERAAGEARQAAYLGLFGDARQSFAEVASNMADEQRARLDGFFQSDGLRRFARIGRSRGLTLLVESDASISDAREAAGRFEEELGAIEAIGSTDGFITYIDNRLEALSREGAAFAMSEAQSPLCILILFLTSIYLLLLVTVIFACAIFGCNIEEVFNALLAEACGEL